MILDTEDGALIVGSIPILRDTRQWRAQPPYALLTYTPTMSLGIDSARCVEIPLTGNLSLTLSGGYVGQAWNVMLDQDAVGGRLVTWPNINRWSGGSPPVLTITPSKSDIVIIRCIGVGSYIGILGVPNF
jgi:hypothetical protein